MTLKPYQIKEVRLVVSDDPRVPVDLASLSQLSFRDALGIYGAFRGLNELDQECLVVLHLDAKNRIRALNLSSLGTISESLAHPREIFRAAIVAGAASIILVHNHPSGDPSPSQQDKSLTRRVSEAGALLGIPLLDHVIVGQSGYYSFSEHGMGVKR